MKKNKAVWFTVFVTVAGLSYAGSMTSESSMEGYDKHKDTDPPSKLTDGRYNSAATRSVEYRGDPELTFTLNEPTEVRRIQVAYYHLNTARIGRIELGISEDGQTWAPAGTVDEFKMATAVGDPAETAEFQVEETISMFRLKVFRAPKSKRVMLGEVIVK